MLTAQVLTDVNLRELPGLNSDIIATLKPGEIIEIHSGPILVNEIQWYQVLWSELGWIAMYDRFKTQLLQFLPKREINLEQLAQQYQIQIDVVNAVIEVESGGQYFGNDGRLIIRFETHIFDTHYFNQTIFYRHFSYGMPKWTDQYFAAIEDYWEPVHTAQQYSEYKCFAMASSLDNDASRLSISMGAPQIMGFNYTKCNYPDVSAMFQSFSESAQMQVEGFFNFCQNSGALIHLQNHNFLEFAKIYNGTGQAQYYADLILATMNK